MNLVETQGIGKSFSIPSVRRDTVREHFLDLFRPRQVEELQVLRDISFQVRRGEALGIMGRNGCGKTTLLKILAGIYQPDSGKVIRKAPITPILELGVGWNGELDAVDNIYLMGSVMGLSLKEIARAIDPILEFAELQRFARLKLLHYSSGMAARLAYSVAFRAVREVLVLDEIFAVGDASFKARCEERFLELKRNGHTMVLVSHSPPIISRFCDRALLLEEGRVLEEGTPDEVAGSYLRLLGGAAPSDP